MDAMSGCFPFNLLAGIEGSQRNLGGIYTPPRGPTVVSASFEHELRSHYTAIQ